MQTNGRCGQAQPSMPQTCPLHTPVGTATWLGWAPTTPTRDTPSSGFWYMYSRLAPLPGSLFSDECNQGRAWRCWQQLDFPTSSTAILSYSETQGLVILSVVPGSGSFNNNLPIWGVQFNLFSMFPDVWNFCHHEFNVFLSPWQDAPLPFIVTLLWPLLLAPIWSLSNRWFTFCLYRFVYSGYS